MTLENIPPENLVKLPMGHYRWEAWAVLHDTPNGKKHLGCVFVKPHGKPLSRWVIYKDSPASNVSDGCIKISRFPNVYCHIHGQLTTYLPAYLNLLA